MSPAVTTALRCSLPPTLVTREIVPELIRAGAPLDHVNKIGWTALIESIALGDGGARRLATLRALVDAGANVNLADRSGASPLALARGRGFRARVPRNGCDSRARLRTLTCSKARRPALPLLDGHAVHDMQPRKGETGRRLG